MRLICENARRCDSYPTHTERFAQELQQKVAQLLHNFDDIQPTLLLFLQKLQCIAITDGTANGKNAVMLRRQLSNGVVELRHGSDAQHIQKWLVVTQSVQPGEWSITASVISLSCVSSACVP